MLLIVLGFRSFCLLCWGHHMWSGLCSLRRTHVPTDCGNIFQLFIILLILLIFYYKMPFLSSWVPEEELKFLLQKRQSTWTFLYHIPVEDQQVNALRSFLVSYAPWSRSEDSFNWALQQRMCPVGNPTFPCGNTWFESRTEAGIEHISTKAYIPYNDLFYRFVWKTK